MKHQTARSVAFLGPTFLALAAGARLPAAETLRIGMTGCDTSHAPAFAAAFNAAAPADDLAGLRLVAVLPTPSDDIPASRDRVVGFTDQLKASGAEVVGSLDELLARVDAVIVGGVDGRKHLEQARAVIAAGKPLFIDKPIAASLADVLRINRLAAEHHVPCFTSSALRYGPKTIATCEHPPGKILGCDAYAPCALEPHHPDLFWYGVHGVEMLFTLMGPGCEKVSRTHTEEVDVVVGVWSGGRVGTFRGIRAGKSRYGAVVFGSEGVSSYEENVSLDPLIQQVARFFKTGKAPVSAAETEAIFTFMEAADESKRQEGKPVLLGTVLEQASLTAAAKQGQPRQCAAQPSARGQQAESESGHAISATLRAVGRDGKAAARKQSSSEGVDRTDT